MSIRLLAIFEAISKTVGFWLAICTSTAIAGNVSSSFNINLRLNDSSSGICVSASKSIQTNALVTVSCNSGQFVSIEPRFGKSFVGVHGGAFRFSFSNRNAVPFEALRDGKLFGDWGGNGTVTALRVMNMVETDEKLELLVSF